MKLETLHDVFVNELRDLYNAENQLVKALPKMAKAACSDDLRMAFENHLAQTERQVERLESIFDQLQLNARGKKCRAMMGLIEEGKEVIDMTGEGEAKDAALITAAQKVEHYEIAAYGSLRTFARLLGFEEAANLLQLSLDEEAQTDESLTQLAQNINVEAVAHV